MVALLLVGPVLPPVYPGDVAVPPLLYCVPVLPLVVAVGAALPWLSEDTAAEAASAVPITRDAATPSARNVFVKASLLSRFRRIQERVASAADPSPHPAVTGENVIAVV
jgi:hypothetical protein